MHDEYVCCLPDKFIAKMNEFYTIGLSGEGGGGSIRNIDKVKSRKEVIESNVETKQKKV